MIHLFKKHRKEMRQKDNNEKHPEFDLIYDPEEGDFKILPWEEAEKWRSEHKDIIVPTYIEF